MLENIKILFLTGAPKSKLLNTLVNNNISISGVVVPKSQKYFSKYQEVILSAEQNNIRTICAPPMSLYEYTKDIEFNVLLSCGYPFFIPEEVYSRAAYAINFHPTLLPKYRGKYLHYVLINNDEYSGVTAHLITSSFDSGPIIKQRTFKVSPFDTVKSLLRKSSEVEIHLVLDVLDLIKNGSVKTTPQDERQSSSYFKNRTPEDSEVDPNKPLKKLFYKIRSCDSVEYPAFFYLEGQKIHINLYRKEKSLDEDDMI